MKLSKIAIILGLFLLPVLLNAQENKTQEKVNRVITQITDNGITFTIPNTVLDSAEITSIKNIIEKQITEQVQTNSKLTATQEINANNVIYDDKDMYVFFFIVVIYSAINQLFIECNYPCLFF